MKTDKRRVGAMQLVLILPAAFFLVAVVARSLQPLESGAQQIVTWYADRIWTLWVLLIGLPLTAFAIGCVALFAQANASLDSVVAVEPPVRIRRRDTTWMVATLTTIAGLILAIVIAHVLAN